MSITRYCPCSSTKKRPSDAPLPVPKRWPRPPQIDVYKKKRCLQCCKKFQNNAEFDVHMQRDHLYQGLPFTQHGGANPTSYLKLTRSLFDSLLNFYQLDLSNNNFTDVIQFFEIICSELQQIISQELKNKKCIKIASEMRCHFYKLLVDPVTMQMVRSIESSPDPSFHGKTHAVYLSDSIPSIVNNMAWRMSESVNSFINKQSGWIFERITGFELSIGQFHPLSGSGFKTSNNLLQHIRSDILLSIDNRDPITNQPDGNCFKMSLVAHKMLPRLKRR